MNQVKQGNFSQSGPGIEHTRRPTAIKARLTGMTWFHVVISSFPKGSLW